jgi:hypothetical protein
MRSNHIHHLAEWHACATFFGGLEQEISLDYDKVLADFAKDGTLPEGWYVWEPFENHDPRSIVGYIESQKVSFLTFHYEVIGAGTYFAQDGNYGSAELLAIVNTEGWTEEDFQEIEEDHDWNAPENAIAIAERHDKEGKK